MENENLKEENKILKSKLEESNNNYKKLSLEIGQIIFENEEKDKEIGQLKNKIKELEQEKTILEKYKKEKESKKWNFKSLIK